MKPGKQEEGKKIHVLKTIMVFNICKDDQTLKYHLSSVILSVKKKKKEIYNSLIEIENGDPKNLLRRIQKEGLYVRIYLIHFAV